MIRIEVEPLFKHIVVDGQPFDGNAVAHKDRPWMWTGYYRSIQTNTGIVQLPHTPRGNPARFLYDRFVQELSFGDRIYLEPGYAKLDVNPWHYKLITRDDPDPPKVAKVVRKPVPPEIMFGEPSTEEALEDLVSALSVAFEKSPFKTWDEYHDTMSGVFVGVLPRDQLTALSRLGINLGGDPKYTL